MKRRNFIKGLVGLAAAPVVVKAGSVIEAVIEKEGGFIVPPGTRKSIGTTTTGNFSKALWPGIEEWYKESYK